MKYRKPDITKSYYENSPYTFLKREEMAAVVLRGENYEDFTKNFQKPYDTIFLASMKKALQYLCRSIPSCLAGYTSRFDMAVFFSAPDSFETPSWYNYDMNRIATLASSMASFAFNRIFEKAADSYVMSGNNFDETRKFTAMQGYVSSIDAGALFTAKCFNIKKEQIADYLYLLQKNTIDAAIHEMGLLYFREDELSGKSSSEIQFMVFDRAGINFDSYPSSFRHGSFCVRNRERNGMLINPAAEKGDWVPDPEFPLLKPDCRDYLQGILG